MTPIVLSRFLGMFSLALGAVEVILPRTLSHRLGTPGGHWLVRAFGLREMAAGFTVLKDPSAVAGPASRVVGDAMDIAVLLPSLSSRRTRTAATVALIAVLGATALDVAATSALVAGEKRRMETARRTRWTHPGRTTRAAA